MNRIKQARLDSGYNRQQVADLLGLSYVSMWRIESDRRNASSKTLERMANLYGVSVDYLLGRDIKKLIDDVIFVPVIDNRITVSAGPGNGYEEIEWEVIGDVPIPTSQLIGYSWQGANFKLIHAEGDSMNPYIADKDLVLFAENVEVPNGEVGIVSVNNKLYVKGLLYGKDKKITLVSFNKNYAERVYNAEEDDIKIIGRVIKVISSKNVPAIM